MNTETLKDALDYAIRVTNRTPSEALRVHRSETTNCLEEGFIALECREHLLSALFIITNEFPLILSRDLFDTITNIVNNEAGFDTPTTFLFKIESRWDDLEMLRSQLTQTDLNSPECRKVREEISSLVTDSLWVQLDMLKETYLSFLYK